MLSTASILAVVLAVTSNAVASPVDVLKERASTACVTYASGYLATSPITSTGKWEPFTFNANNELTYTGGIGTPISVEFQSCTPNYAGGSNTANAGDNYERWGRVYIPSSKQCLAVDGSTGITTRVGCLNSAAGEMTTAASIPQNFEFRTFSSDTSRHIIFWVGAASADGTRLQGTCAGSFGYARDSNFVPVVDSSSRVKAICNNPSTQAGVYAELRATASG